MVKRHSIIERRQLELFYNANPKNAGVLNHEGFYVVDWAKGVAMPDPYSPYDDNDGASLYKAELEPTIQGEITTEPMTVYRRMDWKQYYDGLELGYLHPMRTRMELRPDENIGGTWGRGQPQIWAARKPDFNSPLKHLKGKKAKQLFEIDVPIGTRIGEGHDIQLFDSIPIENVRPFYMGDEEEYTHMAETKPSKIKRCKTCRKEGHNASQCVSENVPFSKGGFWEEYLQSPSYSSTPNKEHRDNPLRFGYQESDLFWDEWGSPYRMKKKWAKNEPYGIAESANFGYGKKGYPYDTGIVKSKPNSPIILSEIMRLGAIEDFSNNLKMAKTTSWGDLKKQLKGKSVVIGEVEYSVPTLKDAFKYLSNETILQIRVVEGEERWNDGLLIISFDYEGERWDFITTPTNATSQPYVEFPIEFKEAFGIQNNIVDAKHMKKYHPHYLRWLKLTDDANLRYCPYGNTEQLYPFDSRLPECVCPLCLKDKNTHMAETKPPKTSKGLIVYPNRMAELIRDGDKQMIVKDKPLDIAGKRYTVVTNRKGYAYIQLGAMQTLTLPKFKALKDKHLITPEERVKYFKGKRRLYAWPVKVLREFDKAYPTNAPLRPQDIAPKLKTYASEETKAHDWELNGVGYDGETVSITCSECGHSDYAQCHIHQLEDLGKNDPKKPIIVRGKDACMNGVQEDCGECEGTGTCDPDFCYAEEGEPHCSLCKGTSICYYCEGTGLDPDVSEGDESHRWRLYAMPHLTHRDRQGVKIICEDCGVGDVFQAFVPSECLGFQGTCLCDFCESHRIDQLEKIDYVIF